MAKEYTMHERRVVLLAACLAAFVTPLLSTMMNLSLVNIENEFDVGSQMLAYVNTSFLLSSVVFMLPMSKAGDIFGKRRMFVVALLIVTVSSILAIFSPTFYFLLGCRVTMGAGSAALVSISISLITDVYPGGSRGGAIGMQTMCAYVGLAAGPPLGGLLNDIVGWRALFVVVLPLAAASLLCMTMFRHEIHPDRGHAFDGKGSVLYGLGIVLTMGGVISMPEGFAFIMLAIGLVFLAFFVKRQLSVPNYLLNVRLFKSRVFAGSCLATFMNYAASYSASYFMALYLQKIGMMTATEAGMLMLLQAGMQAVLTPFFGRMSDRISDKRILPTAGMAMTSLGVAMFLFYGEEMNLTLVLATMLTVGSGLGLFSAPNTSLIMGSVRREETGEASGTVAVMRQTGMLVSMGIAMLFISLIMGGSDNLVPENYGSFVDVIHCSFAVCLCMCLVGMAASMLRGRETKAD